MKKAYFIRTKDNFYLYIPVKIRYNQGRTPAYPTKFT